MRPTATAAALVGLAVAAVDGTTMAIFKGPGAQGVSTKTWHDILDSPANSSSAEFTGFDLTKGYPSAEQQGWQLKIGVKGDLDPPGGSGGRMTGSVMSISPPKGHRMDKADNSWHLCVYAFDVKPPSAKGWGSGRTPSCKGLVANECIAQLQRDAVDAYATGSCPDVTSKPACLRDLDEQKGMALSLTSGEISSAFGGNSTFFRRVDGTSGDAKDTTALYKASGQPMAVITVWGPSGNADKKPTAEAACVMPSAKDASGASARAAAWAAWPVVAIAVALRLAL